MTIHEVEAIYSIAENMTEAISISSYDNHQREALQQVKEVSKLLGVPYEKGQGNKYEWYTVSKDYFQVTYFFED